MSPLSPDRFADVRGYEGIYKAHASGAILSVERLNSRGRRQRERWLAQTLNRRTGYRHVTLTRDGKQSVRTVHSIVCAAFHGPGLPGMEVRHLDGDKAHNEAENLRWGTRSENIADREAHWPDGLSPYKRLEVAFARIAELESMLSFARANNGWVPCGRGPCWTENGHEGDCMPDGKDE